MLDNSQEDDVRNSSAETGYPEQDLEESGTQFTGTTAATATITPKPRRKRSDGVSGKEASGFSKEAVDDRFIDVEQYERERRTDPTLIHSPEEWSSEFEILADPVSTTSHLLRFPQLNQDFTIKPFHPTLVIHQNRSVYRL